MQIWRAEEGEAAPL
jgi:hypothetical protein